MSWTQLVNCRPSLRRSVVSQRISAEHQGKNWHVTTNTSSVFASRIAIGEKHLTPEVKSFMAEEKVLHGRGKVLSTDGKSLLDRVNFGTLVTRRHMRSGDKSVHESESIQRAVECAPTTSEPALRVDRALQDKRRSGNTSIGRLSRA